MTSKDLKDLLEGFAAEGRDTVDLGEDRLAGRIRSRRRRNGIAVAAAGLATAAVTVVAAVAIVPNLGDEQPPVATGPGIAGIGIKIADCGGTVTGTPRADAPLKLSLAGGPQAIQGTSVVASIPIAMTNTGKTPLDATTHVGVELTVVRQGEVVAQSAPVRAVAVAARLQPGDTTTYQAGVSLRRCSASSPQTDEPLPAGTYQLYGTKRFTPNDGGAAIEVQGGPWTVRLG